MVKKSPSLLRRIKPKVAELEAEFNDSYFRPLGSDSDTLDGLNVHGGLLDEIHAWKTKDLYDVIVDGNHRYITSRITGIDVESIAWIGNSKPIISWMDVILDPVEWRR